MAECIAGLRKPQDRGRCKPHACHTPLLEAYCPRAGLLQCYPHYFQMFTTIPHVFSAIESMLACPARRPIIGCG